MDYVQEMYTKDLDFLFYIYKISPGRGLHDESVRGVLFFVEF
jgi:hypothetical protein